MNSTPACRRLVACLFAFLLASPAAADLGDCGHPVSATASPTASDALLTLRVAVGLSDCPLATCDVDCSCGVTAVDALRVLLRAVGDPTIVLSCSCGITTSTTLSEIPFWPADAADYVAGPLSYVDEITVPGVEMDVPVCCKDFGEISKDFIENGTDQLDNGLAVLSPLLALIGVDFSEQLNMSIQDGSLVVLLDHQFLDLADGSGVVARGGLPDDEFALVQLEAVFADGTTFAEASVGDGEFVILPGTFLPGSGEPAAVAFPAFMDVDGMSAGPFELDLTLSFGILDIDIIATQAEVTATPGQITPAGIPYTEGIITGIVQLDDVFADFNSVLGSSDCACLGLTDDVFTQLPDGSWRGSCVPDGAALCSEPREAVCATLAGSNPQAESPEICALFPPVLQNVAADLDLDGDPSRYEGMSIGLRFTAVPAASATIEP